MLALAYIAFCPMADAAGVSKIYKFSSIDTGSNLLTDTVYGASDYTDRTIGNQPGIAKSKLVNKGLRQSTAMASGLALFCSRNVNGITVTDNDSAAAIATYIEDAIAARDTSAARIAILEAKLAAQVGTVTPYAGATAPADYLLCQGQSVLRASYPALFSVIGTTYGYADGAHFTIPDLRARVPVGVNSDGNLWSSAVARTNKVLADCAGEETHVLTAAELAKHTHPASSGTESATHTHGYSLYAMGEILATGLGSTHAAAVWNQTPQTSTESATHTHAITVSNQTVGDQAHNNMQPYIVLNYIIKYQ